MAKSMVSSKYFLETGIEFHEVLQLPDLISGNV